LTICNHFLPIGNYFVANDEHKPLRATLFYKSNIPSQQ
jgi:hypothetical protein